MPSIPSARALFLPALLLSIASAAHAEDPSITKIRKEIEAARKRENVPGMSLAIVKDGKVIFGEGFGMRNVAKRQRATADTVYEIGSCTKSFTALMAAQAVQEGKLSFADKPTKYLPAFRLKDPAANSKITLEDMLSHRSGLPRVDLAWYAGDFSRDELLTLASEAQATAPLGAKWQYQNLMFLFSGMIEEKVYGKPYETLLQEKYFTPLGMTHSDSTYAATMAQPMLATGYSGANPVPLKAVDRIAPAGTISSNVHDMARYVQMLLGDGKIDGKSVFSQEAIEETRKKRIEMFPGSGKFYGLGWMLGTERGVKNVFHGGNIDGFTAYISLYPSEHLGIVALSNADSASLPQEAADIVFKALGPKEAAAKDAAVFNEADVKDLGDYRLATPPVELKFIREGKATFMVQNGQKIPLKLVGDKRYSIQDVVYLTFGAVDKDGKKGVKLEQSGMTFMLQPSEPFKSPIAAADLLAKAVQAEGGAEAIRRHARMVVRYRQEMPSDAVTIYGIRYRRDEISGADIQQFFAMNRRFADVRTFIDGTSSGLASSFGRTSMKSGPEAADDLLASNLEADLQPTVYYKSLDVVREDKVNNVPVYVLQKTSLSGQRTLAYISKVDFRVLRTQSVKTGPAAYQEYSDFRTVDGLVLPFKSVSVDAAGAKTSEEILSVRFDERVPDWIFKP